MPESHVGVSLVVQCGQHVGEGVDELHGFYYS